MNTRAERDRLPGPADSPASSGAIPPSDGENSLIEELFTRVIASADREGLIDIAYRTLDSPLGPLLVAATPTGVVRLAFAVQGHDRALEELATQVSPRVLRLPWRLDAAAAELDEYFHGRRTQFSVPVDLRLAQGFQRSVLEQLPTIPYGSTAGYARVAQSAGSAGAARAVGTACARNPVPILVPCHRVTRSDGSLGGYIAGPAAKRFLLEVESGSAEGGPASTPSRDPQEGTR